MNEVSVPRRTIATAAELSGVGLHTGATTRVSIHPGAADQGIVFRRTDLDGRPEVPARVSEVEATERRTAIGHGETTIHTVEHLLAAVMALDLDDLLIELDGPEPPILDGSFAPYFDVLEAAGVRAHEGEPTAFTVTEPFALTEGDATYVVSPLDGLRLTTTIEWNHPLIGRQTGSWDITAATFRGQLARARTFGFTHEVEALRSRGLLKGGSTDSAVVLSETEVVGTTLRWPDEFVRHKAGDILGDLALVGGRIKAHVIANRPSHQGNVALARMIARTAERTGGRHLDINRILQVIPHRYPFIMVDRILELEPRRRVVGIKNVTINEPFFQGHFPGHPVMPGVLIIESMAQAGGMLLMDELQSPENKVVYFMSLDNVKFRRPVLPGDQLRSEVEMIQFRGRTCRMKGIAYVDGQVVAEAEMLARVMDR
ncbi:MAG: bifunctional UDP-3-O-[3-hydroxymyristoyl] N-acetylglucosamine deacetylase/3-hydroxyacyl-ACP dehydratase [Gemmatimonadales bacterium]|nr:bifunctional UDP-3-O-[3-hydroxymyristoyl] N-acetylglucosamine deacetylase/3-hydroxyacyl-ACP dehydratase [Gemmatimonadales bacterium]